MKLSAAQRAQIRRQTRPHATDPFEDVGELNIVPFLDITVNMIVFMLVMAASLLAVAQVAAQLPTYGPPRPGRALDLNVILTDQGITVAGSGGQLAPGCEATGTPGAPTIPRLAAAYDFTALTACVARVKDAYPDEVEVTIGAEPTVAYQDVIRALDAVRNRGSRPLFTDVRISAGLR